MISHIFLSKRYISYISFKFPFRTFICLTAFLKIYLFFCRCCFCLFHQNFLYTSHILYSSNILRVFHSIFYHFFKMPLEFAINIIQNISGTSNFSKIFFESFQISLKYSRTLLPCFQHG